MAIQPALLAVLKLVDQDQIYWTRSGGSDHYQRHFLQVKELIRQGLVLPMQMDCCRKDYLVTAAGEAVLKGSGK